MDIDIAASVEGNEDEVLLLTGGDLMRLDLKTNANQTKTHQSYFL